MCIIAGYNGTKRAAPLIIEMLRKTEGIDAGCYTGIATLHEGKIHYRKLAGNLDRLLAETDAMELPGNIGIIHSRTPGESDTEGVEYAHPFVTRREGEAVAAMVLNGTAGCFKPRRAERVEITERLLREGAVIPSLCEGTGNLNLPGGRCVHSSDVFCQLADQHVQAGMDVPAALAKTFSELPTEAVVLMLSLIKPDAIAYARLNFPMHLAFCDHGAYLSTTPQVFPSDARDYTLLPVLSAGYIYRDRFESSPFPICPATVAPLNPARRHRIYEVICDKLAEGEQTVSTLAEAIRHVFEGYDCGQVGAAIYQVLDDLQREGRLLQRVEYIKGQFEGLQAPLVYLSVC